MIGRVCRGQSAGKGRTVVAEDFLTGAARYRELPPVKEWTRDRSNRSSRFSFLNA